MEKYLYIGCTLALTVDGQLVVKSRSLIHDGVDVSGSKLRYLTAMFTDFAAWSGLAAAVLARIFWFLAIQKTCLRFAYPSMALYFFLIPLGAAFFLGEALSLVQLCGLFIIVFGVTLSVFAR